MRYPLSLMLKVARMYYHHRIPQKEIAEQLGISIATVSRILRETLKSGIVQIKIEDRQKQCEKLERSLKEKYGLLKTVVVRSSNIINGGYLKRALGEKAASLLKKILKAGMIIGLGPGETIMEMVLSFSADDMIPGVTIVPLMGGWGLYQLERETNRLVSILGTVLGCKYYFFNSPALVSSADVKQLILKEQLLRKIVELWERLDLVVFSIGPEIEDGILAMLMSEKELRKAILDGAVSDILGIVIDENGKELNFSFNERIVSIPLKTLKKAPIRIGIGGGSRKIRGLKACLKGRLINILVTDERSAKHLVNEE